VTAFWCELRKSFAGGRLLLLRWRLLSLFLSMGSIFFEVLATPKLTVEIDCSVLWPLIEQLIGHGQRDVIHVKLLTAAYSLNKRSKKSSCCSDSRSYGVLLNFSGRSQQPKMKKIHVLNKKLEFISFSEMKFPKPGILLTNNYWVGRFDRSNFEWNLNVM